MHFPTHSYGFLPFPIGSYKHAKKTEPCQTRWANPDFFLMLIHPNGREAGRGGGHTGSPNGSGRGGWDFFKYWFTQRVLSTGSPNRSWGRGRLLS